MCEMNVLCASDRNFLYQTYVMLYSIIKNHPEVLINIFLLASEDINLSERNELKEFINNTGNKITFLEVDEEQYSDFIFDERFTKAAYFRLMAHCLLPKEVTRILYLDIDIIVDKNIYSDFYNLDFHDKYLIATSHNPNPDYCNILEKSIVNYESAAKGEYFNSGVLVMNIEKLRTNVTIKTYVDIYKTCEKEGIEIFYDQGLLNLMFFDKTLYLSSMDYNYRFSIPRDYAKRIDKNNNYKKAIIHYTGMKQLYKPWDLLLSDEEINKFGNVPFESQYFYVDKELNDLMKIWWSYAEKTPVYTELLHDMEIKSKWFRRNLLKFMLDHNRTISTINNK